jgi:hypothetical protein
LAPTVGIAATGFCYPGGILQIFIDKISKFCGCPTAADRLFQQDCILSDHLHRRDQHQRIIYINKLRFIVDSSAAVSITMSRVPIDLEPASNLPALFSICDFLDR